MFSYKHECLDKSEYKIQSCDGQVQKKTSHFREQLKVPTKGVVADDVIREPEVSRTDTPKTPPSAAVTCPRVTESYHGSKGISGHEGEGRPSVP